MTDLVHDTAVPVAVIDIGTNSVLMTVAARDEVEPSGFRVIAEYYEQPRLGRGVDASRALSDESMQRTLVVLRRYLEEAQRHGASHVVAAATAAVRDAANREVFLARARDEVGLCIDVISGDHEAALIFSAATGDFANASPDHRLATIDVGGGSTEFIAGRLDPATGAVSSLDKVSLALGCVRMTERHVFSDPVNAGDYAALVDAVREVLSAVPESIAEGLRTLPLVGCSGTLTSLKAVELELEPYDAKVVHGSRLTLDEIDRQIAAYWLPLTLAEKARVRGLGAPRADVALTGAVICAEALRYFGRDAFIVSDRGLRYGLLRQLLARTTPGH